MKKQHLLTLGCATLFFATAGASLRAQDSPRMVPAHGTAANAGKVVPSKQHKVWTNDDISSRRGPTEDQVDKERPASAATSPAAVEQAKSAKPGQPTGAKPALSDPQSIEDADRMVAWENRDIDAQQEFLDKLRDQHREARPEDRDRIQRLIDERVEIIAQTKKERDALLVQKQKFEKRPASSANSKLSR